MRSQSPSVCDGSSSIALAARQGTHRHRRMVIVVTLDRDTAQTNQYKQNTRLKEGKGREGGEEEKRMEINRQEDLDIQ